MREFPADDLGRFAGREAEPIAIELVATHNAVMYPVEERSPFRAIPSTERSVLQARVVRIRDGTRWREAAGATQVTVIGRLEGVAPGDRLRVFGQLRRPSVALNPGERDARRAAHAERRTSVVWSESTACVAALQRRGDDSVGVGTVDAIRSRLSASIDGNLSAGAAPVVKAMLLGDRTGIDRETIDAFRRTGTLHVLVVSGLHMGLVAGGLLMLNRCGLAPRGVGLLLCVGAVVAYAAIAGAAPPAMRAAVLAGAACLATLVGRRALGANSLAGAAIAVFMASPGAWLGDGTRLSFLSAATLLAVARVATRWRSTPTPPLERLIEQTRPPLERAARRLASWSGWLLFASIAVFVVTGPLLAQRFHLLSPIAVPLSLAVLPLVSLIVGSGLAMATLGATLSDWTPDWALEPIVRGFGWACETSADCLTWLIRTAADAPAGSFYTPGPYGWWAAAWFTCLAVTAALAAYGGPWRGFVSRGALALVAMAFAPSLVRIAEESISGPPPLRCSFVAVGHGAATLLETPAGGAILCDAGALGAPQRVADTIARALWSRGVTRLDAVVLTHADVDHYNALPALLDRFEVEELWTTNMMLPRFVDGADQSAPAELRRVLDAHGVPIRLLQTGDQLRLGPDGEAAVRAEVLHPSDLGVAGSDNANSLVLGIEHRGRRLLLTGDLESPGLDQLLEQKPYYCDVLVAPHHGSERSNPPGLAAWCRPEFVIISSGGPHPGAGRAYRSTGAGVANTYETGMLTVRLGDDGVHAETFRPPAGECGKRTYVAAENRPMP